MIRLYLPLPLAEGALLDATPAQAHYLATVMRLKPGSAIRVFNGTQGEWDARIERLARGKAALTALHRVKDQAPEPDLWLLFAPLKRDMTDLVVQKATELGVSKLLPVLTERTNSSRLNLERLTSIAIEAAEQCERLTVPVVSPLQRLADVLTNWPDHRALFVALERDQSPSPPAAVSVCALMIGPEGGLGPSDRALLRQSASVRPLSLGPRILRAETAAIVGLALLQRPGCG